VGVRGKIRLTSSAEVYSLSDPSGEARKMLLRGADPQTVVRRYRDLVVEEIRREGNTLLQEGVNFIFRAIAGLSPSPFFDEQNSYIGVGDSDAPPDKSQTGLLGANIFYKRVSPGYPTIEGHTMAFCTWFDYGEANFYWREWTIANGPGNEAVNLNRAAQDLGEKTGDIMRVILVWLTSP